jgi:hypothetical protein
MHCLDDKKKPHKVLVLAIMRDPRRALKEAAWWLKNQGLELVVVIGHNAIPRAGGGIIPVIYYYVRPIPKQKL